ncbi:MAG: TerD family protein [Desulfuromonadaceae bacterium]
MTEYVRGQKGKLVEMGCTGAFPIELKLAKEGMNVDIACFGLDVNEQLSDDRYMIFYNQKSSPSGEVALEISDGKSLFTTDVSRLPDFIYKLVFAASIEGEGTMCKLGSSSMHIGNTTFLFSGTDFQNEKAVIIGEIYKRDGQWRFGAVGQGFNGGLSSLLKHFGGEEKSPVTAPESQSFVESSVPKLVTLTKQGELHKVSLQKGKGAPSKIIVRATWVDNGDGRDDNDDLDLRIGILLPDGRMKIIRAPDDPGSFLKDPYVFHTGDVTGASENAPGVETVEINPEISMHLGGRIALVCSVYSAITNGAVSVASLKPRMRMEYGSQVVECAFDFNLKKECGFFSGLLGILPRFEYTYVIGLIEIDQNHIILKPSGVTSSSMSEATPWLVWDKDTVKLTMDGPLVFKGKPISPSGGKQYS